MQPLQAPTLPYCGAPPNPSSLFSRWNLDPVLIACLLVVLLAYFTYIRHLRFLSHSQQILFLCGWFLSFLALVSPLCPLSVSLFSARVSQHMLLVLIGAPLIVAGWPRATTTDAHSVSPRASVALPSSIAFAAMLWLWHIPFFYDLTFSHSLIYWIMHISLFGSALCLWWCLLDLESSSALRGLGAAVFASIQMGLLGAILTFAPRAMYSPHYFTTQSWNLTPLQDQQLGGVIMWVPGGIVLLLVTMYSMARLLAPASTIKLSWAERFR